MTNSSPLRREESDDQMKRLLDAWEVLRTSHREMPAQAVSVLLYVASHNECHKQAIEEDLGLTTASCSRVIDCINKGTGRAGVKTPGLGLVQKYVDPSNRRRLLVKLTPKGEHMLHQIKNIVNQ